MRIQWAVPVIASILILGLFGSVHGLSPLVIPPGFDSLTTGSSAIDFSSPSIPADFFGPGSDPFSSVVPLEGVGADLGFGPFNFELSSAYGSSTFSLSLDSDLSLIDTDTVIERQGAANLPNIGSTDTIPIEIVEMNLVSVNPITVTENGGLNPELWDVEVQVPGPQTQGTMTITRTLADGGTFDSSLPVSSVITFTRVSGPILVVSLDPPLTNTLLTSTNSPWSVQIPVGGTFLPIDSTALLVAGAQTISPWLILGVLSAVGIGIAVFTLKRR